MNRLRLSAFIGVTLFVSVAVCSTAQAQSRTFVSGLGSDANPCTRTAPCRSFQKAHDVVAANGEVVALDSAGYGKLIITKSVTISGEGQEAESSAASGDTGILISTSGITVVLRSISIEGFGTGGNGINVTSGGGTKLTLQHCVIHGFTGDGLNFVISSGTGKLSVTDSRITDCGMNGVALSGVSGGNVKATISNTRIENSGSSGLLTVGAKVTIHNSATSGGALNGIVASTTSTVNVESCESSNNGLDGIQSATATSVVRVSRSIVTDNGRFGFNNAGGVFESESAINTGDVFSFVRGNLAGETNGAITFGFYQ